LTLGPINKACFCPIYREITSLFFIKHYCIVVAKKWHGLLKGVCVCWSFCYSLLSSFSWSSVASTSYSRWVIYISKIYELLAPILLRTNGLTKKKSYSYGKQILHMRLVISHFCFFKDYHTFNLLINFTVSTQILIWLKYD